MEDILRRMSHGRHSKEVVPWKVMTANESSL